MILMIVYVVSFGLYDGLSINAVDSDNDIFATFGSADVSVVFFHNSEDYSIVIIIDYSICWGGVLMLDFFFLIFILMVIHLITLIFLLMFLKI